MLKLKTPIMHCVYFSTWVTSVLLSMNWSEIIPWGMIKHIFNLTQNRKLTRNMISCIFQLNCKANAANLKQNSVFIQAIRRESAACPLLIFCIFQKLSSSSRMVNEIGVCQINIQRLMDIRLWTKLRVMDVIGIKVVNQFYAQNIINVDPAFDV